MKDERAKKWEERGVVIYSGNDEVPSDVLNSKVVYTFSVNQVERDGEQYLGIHVQWPEGAPNTWPKDSSKLTDSQIVALSIAAQVESLITSILPSSPDDARDPSGKSMEELMEELNSIDPDVPTKH